MPEANTEKEPIEVTENEDGSVIAHIPDDPDAGMTEGEGGGEGEEVDRAPVTGRTAHEDEDDGPTEAEELRTAANEAARERIRARRRAERKQKKADAAERESSLRAQLAASEANYRHLAEKVNKMERKTSGTELAQLDHALGQAQGAVEHYKKLMSDAAVAGNQALVAEATEKWVEARDRVRDMAGIRQQIATPQQQTVPLDPVLMTHANAWMERNPWYKPQSKEADTLVVLALDQAIAQEGIPPNTPQYWKELDRRVSKYLPHRAQRSSTDGAGGDILPGDGERKPGKSVVTGGSGRSGAAAGSAESGFKLSAARVQALKDAGDWDDPVRRTAAIKDYREYDRQAAAANKS